VRKGRFDPDGIVSIPATPSLERSGAFVTLKCKGGADGTCTGPGRGVARLHRHLEPSSSVYDVVAHRAASAALEDTRFPHSVTVEDCLISIEVSVLTPPRPVKSADEIVMAATASSCPTDGTARPSCRRCARAGWDAKPRCAICTEAGLPATPGRRPTLKSTRQSSFRKANSSRASRFSPGPIGGAMLSACPGTIDADRRQFLLTVGSLAAVCYGCSSSCGSTRSTGTSAAGMPAGSAAV